ncbi:MAG: mechanosensitive ion channel [Alphaproteobacteria bacterium]|nr:mechanosensitive ion channel [Alphaproteobacteria bacterium]
MISIRHWRPLALMLALLAALAIGAAPRAQTGETKPNPADEIQVLIKTLEDEGARAKLITQLRALMAAGGVPAAETQPAAPTQPEAEVKPDSIAGLLIAGISERIQQFGRDLQGTADLLRDLPRLYGWLKALTLDEATRDSIVLELMSLAAILGVAFAVEFGARLVLTRPRLAIEALQPANLAMRALWLLGWTVLHLLPILGFQFGAYVVLSLLQPDLQTQLVALVLINANILARVVVLVARFLTVPDASNLRLLPLESETAAYLFIWARRLTNIAAYGIMAGEAALVLGLPAQGYLLWIKLIGSAVALLLAVFVLQNRKTFGDWLRGAEAPASAMAAGLQGLRQRLADIWHVLALLYIAAIYLVRALGITGGFEFILRASVLTAAVLAIGRLALAGTTRALTRSFAVSADLAQRFPGLERRANLYLPLLRRVLNGVVWAVAGLLLLQVWGINAFAWIASPIGRRIVGAAITIMFILAVATIVWEVASTLIERYLQRIATESAGGNRRARLRTFLPLLRNVLFIVLVAVVTLVVLSEIGVNIAPLLAGAGVIGLAIGFGSQAVVRDVITGLFILFEDTINVGDIVDVGGSSGVVESITIRTLKLRDARGNLHTIPFGSVGSVKNMTKDFAYYLFDIGLAKTEQIDAATEALRAIDAEMRADPTHKADQIGAIEISGVDSFTGSGVVLRARIKTVAGRQWSVGREYNRRIKTVFEQRAIAMTG